MSTMSSFLQQQEGGRASYPHSNPPHPHPHQLYVPPPGSHSSQAAPYYARVLDPSPLREIHLSRGHPSNNIIHPREASPSSQLQASLNSGNSYVYQLQQAAQSRPSPSQTQNSFGIIPQPPLVNSQQSHNSESPVPNGVPTAMANGGGQNRSQEELDTASMTPPPEGTYPTFDALLAAANKHAFARGYALVIGRSKKKNKVGLKKVLLTCDKGGTSKHNMLPIDSPLRKRVTTSRKTGCKFGIYASETAMEWTLKYRPDDACMVHNHPPSKGAIEHPAARKLDASAVAAVKALKEAGVSAQETLKQIQAAQPGAKLLARDVYNARAALRREPSRGELDPSIIPNAEMSSIYKRAVMTPEERFKDSCRVEISKAKEELEQYKEEAQKEIEELKMKLREKDKLIEKFEMFIDICNGRVMAQRERLADDPPRNTN